MTRSILFAQERRTLRRDGLQLGLIALFAATCVYAMVQGARHRSGILDSAREFQASALEEATRWRERVVAIEAGEVAPEEDRWAGLAMGVSRPAVMEPGVLADFSHGVSDVHPYVAEVSVWRSVDRLFGNHQFQNPNEIRGGQFDLCFVILFIMPLLMIALAFGVLADDRDGGRLPLLLSQPISVRQLVTSRLAVRLGGVFIVMILALLAGLFVGARGLPDAERLARFLIWLGAASCYFLAWSGLILWGVSLHRGGETTALILVGIWSLNSLVGPALLSSAAQLLHPAPSQMAFLTRAREVSSDAYRSRSDVMQGMLLDHPELNLDHYTIPEYIRTSFLVTQTVDQAVEPVLAESDVVHAERRSFLNVMQYLAPSAVAMQAMNVISGSDRERQIRFEREVREFKRRIAESIEANVLAGEPLSVAQIDRLPTFAFEERGHVATLACVSLPLAYLALLAAMFACLGLRNLTKLQTRIGET